MAFSVSAKSKTKAPGSSSTLYAATSRDYDRKRLAAKQELKLEKDYDALEHKMMAHAKWNQRAENNNLRPNAAHNTNPSPSTSSLDNYMQQEKAKQDNIINAKRMANDKIRRTSVITQPKV